MNGDLAGYQLLQNNSLGHEWHFKPFLFFVFYWLLESISSTSSPESDPKGYTHFFFSCCIKVNSILPFLSH